MRVTFLGTSAGVPTRARNVSSVALKLPQRGEVWLFDCGEGATPARAGAGERVARLEAEVERLHQEVAELRRQLEDFRRQFE